MSDFTFDGFEPSNTTPVPDVCWRCQQPYYRYSGQWAKSGYVQSQLCQRCYGELLSKVVRQKKRAKNKGNEATLTVAQWGNILRNSEGCCYYCHQYIGFQSLTLEHLLPIARGGGTTAENVVPACMGCNAHQWLQVVREAQA